MFRNNVITAAITTTATTTSFIPSFVIQQQQQQQQMQKRNSLFLSSSFSPFFLDKQHDNISKSRRSLSSKHFSSSLVNINQEETISTTSHGTTSYNVIVKRNKQSKMFREGSPLVFSGALDCTYQLSDDIDERIVQDEKERNGGGIPMGTFVSLYVSISKPDNKSPQKSFSKNKRGKQRQKQQESLSSYPHLHLPPNDALLKENTQQMIGYGIYNPYSMYRVRILCHKYTHSTTFDKITSLFQQKNNEEEKIKEAMKLILKDKLKDAIQTRKALKLPSTTEETLTTDTYRLINGEGDGLSGLAMDVMGGKVVVIMSSASWCEIYKEEIMEALQEVLKDEKLSTTGEGVEMMDIVWRNTPSRLEQDGYYKITRSNNDNDNNEQKEQDEEEEDEEKCVILTENSIKYKSYPYSQSQQKTGFYCDQRSNRQLVSQYTTFGKSKVLDLCCYSGGFAINAMIHGNASYCCGVDSSGEAIEMAIENAILNGLHVVNNDDDDDDDDMGQGGGRIEFVQADIARFMKDKLEAQQQAQEAQSPSSQPTEYDVIILDPPKLAPTTSSLDKASRKYHALNRDAIKLINAKEGGLLLTCTCSGAMTTKDGGTYFLNMVKNAALSAGRRVTLVRVSGAAECHVQNVASWPAGAYLTAALFHVSPVG